MKIFQKVKKGLSEKYETSNLSKSGQRGLKLLQKIVSIGEIVINGTDKSKRTKQQYEESGRKHTKGDTEIPTTSLPKKQGLV